MPSPCCSSLLLLITLQIAQGRLDFDRKLLFGRVENPGMHLRLMPSGLAYVREVGMKLLNKEIPRIVLPRFTETVEGKNKVIVINARIDRYFPPQEYELDLVPINQLIWTMIRMDVHPTGQFIASIHLPLLITPIELKGDFNAEFNQISLVISVSLTTLSNGAPNVRSRECRMSIGNVDMVIRNTGLLTDFVINALKGILIAQVKPLVERRICERIENIIDTDVNNILSTMPLTIRLNEQSLDLLGGKSSISLQRNSSSISAIEISNLDFITNIREQPFIIDYRLINQPFIQSGSVNLYCKGEISWKGLGKTPFYPPTINIPSVQGTQMLEFYGTDYMVNSLFYHGYKQRILDVIVGPESSDQFRQWLRTTCQTGFCMGEVLGDLGDIYPNKKMEIHFKAIKAPVLYFKEGKATIFLTGLVSIFVRDGRRTRIRVIKSRAKMEANLLLLIRGNNIRGNSTVEVLDLTLLESLIPTVDQEILSDLSFFGAEFLGSLLTEIFSKGIIIPTVHGLLLKRPTLTIHDRYLLVRSYFTLNERYASHILSGAVKEGLSHFG